MAQREYYLTATNSQYVNLMEPDDSQTGQEYMNLGNTSSGSARFILIRLPSLTPEALTNWWKLRLAEYNSDFRGDTALTAKCYPVTGDWDTATRFDTIPSYNAGVVATYNFNEAVPSSSNYDYRTGYHSASYTYRDYYGNTASGPWTLYNWQSITASQYNNFYNAWGGTEKIEYVGGGDPDYIRSTISYTAAYYDTYVKYRTIDITNVVQWLIANSKNSILLSFDLPGPNNSRKYFKSMHNTNQAYQPLLIHDYTPYSPPPPPPDISRPGKPSWVSISPNPFDNTVDISWGGATHGINNPITMFALHYVTSTDGVNYSPTGIPIVDYVTSDTGGTYTATVNVPYNTYIKLAILTVGTTTDENYRTADGWAFSNAIQRTLSNPGAPTVLQTDPTTPDKYEREITLVWSGASAGANNPIAGYEINYRYGPSENSLGSYVFTATIETTETSGQSVRTTTIQYDTWIQYRIRTIGQTSDGNYKYSDWVEFPPIQRLPAPERPTAPDTFTVTPNPFETTVTGGYSGAEGNERNEIIGYEIFIKKGNKPSELDDWKLIASVSDSTFSFEYAPAEQFNYVKFGVRAVGSHYDTAYKYSDIKESGLVIRSTVEYAPVYSVELVATHPAKHITVHKERVFISDGNFKVKYSRPFSPTDFSPDQENPDSGGGEIIIGTEQEGRIVGLATYGDTVTVFKESAVYEIYGTSPSSYDIRLVAGRVSPIGGRKHIVHEGILYFLTKDGLAYCDHSIVDMLPNNDRLRLVWRDFETDPYVPMVVYKGRLIIAPVIYNGRNMWVEYYLRNGYFMLREQKAATYEGTAKIVDMFQHKDKLYYITDDNKLAHGKMLTRIFEYGAGEVIEGGTDGVDTIPDMPIECMWQTPVFGAPEKNLIKEVEMVRVFGNAHIPNEPTESGAVNIELMAEEKKAKTKAKSRVLKPTDTSKDFRINLAGERLQITVRNEEGSIIELKGGIELNLEVDEE